MPENITYTMLGGRFIQEVVSVTLVNNTELTENRNIPANKKRILLSIKAVNPDDVNRGFTIIKFKEVARTTLVKRMLTVAALGASGETQWPYGEYTQGEQRKPTLPFEIFVGGNVLQIIWQAGGASAGGVDADGLVIEWLEFDE